MNFFTTVEQKHSTTKLGEILTCRVVEIYENAVLTRDQALQIPAWLNLQIAEMCRKNKRLAPMVVMIDGARYKPDECINRVPRHICVVTESRAKAQHDDGRPFSLYLHMIRNDHTWNPALLGRYDEAIILDALKGNLSTLNLSLIAAAKVDRLAEVTRFNTLASTIKSAEAAVMHLLNNITDK